jgi:hypothetical protein
MSSINLTEREKKVEEGGGGPVFGPLCFCYRLESEKGGRESFGRLPLPPFMKHANTFLLINLPQTSAGASELGGGVLPIQLHRTSQVAINTARKTNKLR